MEVKCPNCNQSVSADELNVQTDVGKCNNCGNMFRVSQAMKDRREELEAFFSPEAKQEVAEQQEAESPDKKRDPSEPPVGSNIQVFKTGTNSYEIIVPPQGLKARFLPMILFNAFWLGFITLWTTLASAGGGIFGLFSLPFWVVGVWMLRFNLNNVIERQVLELTEDELIIKKRRMIFHQNRRISRHHIERIRMAPMENKWRGQNQPTPEGPTVFHGVRKTHFFDNLTEAEGRWIINFLRRHFKK